MSRGGVRGPRNKVGNKFDPEVRFAKFTKWGEPPEYRPELGSCLIFTGADNGNGYGQFAYGPQLPGSKRRGSPNGYAHRYAWERTHGPIPDGLTVDHLCRVRRCVNVEHLELTDQVDNYLRGVAARDKCPNGHPYTPDNLYTKASKPGIRFCKTCIEKTKRRGGLRRTNAFNGVEERRQRYDAALRDRLVVEAVERRLTVAEAAERLGCTKKYMDKLVRREARARGVPNRRHHKGPVVFNGWTERTTRVAVHQRSNGVCERCDQARATDMHHRKNRSQSGQWHPANIVHLCALCHVTITAEPDIATADGFTVKSYDDPSSVPVIYRGSTVWLDDLGNMREAA